MSIGRLRFEKLAIDRAELFAWRAALRIKEIEVVRIARAFVNLAVLFV